MIISNLNIDLKQKQELLEITSIKNRLNKIYKFIISEKAWRMSESGYSSMFVMLNDQVSVEDLLKGIIIVSGNDACVALAEGLSGTEEDFANLMNMYSEKLGMKNSYFVNSSGVL